MNTYGLIILLGLICEFVLHRIAEFFNLRYLNSPLPPLFQDVYDETQYARSQAYHRVNTYFGWIHSTWDLLLFLGFWFAKGFNALDLWIQSFHFHWIWNGLLYIGILGLAKSLLSLPFEIYDTFVIEEKFGFNKTTPKIFILDHLKALGLGIVLGGPLLAGILAFFHYTGKWAWLYCWLVAMAFSLFIQYIAPTWIFPLFNRFTPLQEENLRKAVFEYAHSVGFPIKDIFVMDGSKRSTKANAFFTGFGKNKRIVLYDTLISQHSESEIVSILGHEIGHYKLKHMIQTQILMILHTGILFYLLSLFLTKKELFEAFYMEKMSLYAGLLIFGVLYTPIEFFLNILLNWISRHNETQADQFAVQTTRTPEALIQALKKLSARNLTFPTAHPFYVLLNFSHPPMLKRIQQLQLFSKKL